MLKIEVGFDGSCPQSLEGVRQEGEATFRILPSWRVEPGVSEETVGRTTRLGFRVVNDGGPTRVTLHIDWQYGDAPPDTPPKWKDCADYMRLRDFCVVREPDSAQWRYVVAHVKSAVATLVLTLRSGITEIHWHPPYSYSQGEAFVAELRDREHVAVERIGRSAEGRNLWLLGITDGTAAGKKPFMIRARTHAYESAGSYAMEGMVRFLLGADAWAAMARRDYAFYILPMMNPDGVHNGMGRLTAPRGANPVFARPASDDPGYAAMMAVAARVRPMRFVDLHNWQSKWRDGLLHMPPQRRERFFMYMPDYGHQGKSWRVRDPDDLSGAVPEQETLGRYCRWAFGAESVTFEVSWFGRSPEDVRAFGGHALRALLMLDMEPAGPDAV